MSELSEALKNIVIYKKMVDYCPILLCACGMDGKFVMANKAFMMFGYDREKLYSTPFMDFVHSEDKEKTTAALLKLTQGQNIYVFENRWINIRGEAIGIKWACYVEGELIFATATITN